MTLTEALAEKAARGELAPAEVQSVLAILLRDLLSREGSGGVVSDRQDNVVTRKISESLDPGKGDSP